MLRFHKLPLDAFKTRPRHSNKQHAIALMVEASALTPAKLPRAKCVRKVAKALEKLTGAERRVSGRVRGTKSGERMRTR